MSPTQKLRSLDAVLARLARGRSKTRSAADRALREHYRKHRRIRWGPLTSIVGIPRVQEIIFLGELEHRIGLVTLRSWMTSLRRHLNVFLPISSRGHRGKKRP